MEAPTTPMRNNLQTDRVVNNGLKRAMLQTMAELFDYEGYKNICARLSGYKPPTLLAGTQHDVRPDLFCKQNDRNETPLLLESVTPEDFLDDATFKGRVTLLAHCREAYGWELHFCVPTVKVGGKWLAPQLRARLELLRITPNKIWVF